MQVNILQAKTDFSKLIRILESGRESSITIARNGKPVARIILAEEPEASRRIGAAKGVFKAPDDFDAANKEAAEMLMEGSL